MKNKPVPFDEADFCFFPLFNKTGYWEAMVPGKKLLGLNYFPPLVSNRIRIRQKKREVLYNQRYLEIVALEPPTPEELSSEQHLMNAAGKLLALSQTELLPRLWVFGNQTLMLNLGHYLCSLGYKTYYHTRNPSDHGFILFQEKMENDFNISIAPVEIMPCFRNVS